MRFASHCLVLAVGAMACAASAQSVPAKHLSLAKAVGSCGALGGSFYLCPPPSGPAHSVRHYRTELTGRARSANGRRTFDETGLAQVILQNGWAFGPRSGVTVSGQIQSGSIVMFSYAPKPSLLPGYAVWKLNDGASYLRLQTLSQARLAQLFADGRKLQPELVISPATEIHDPALRRLFNNDMQHLIAIANGNPKGACRFFKPSNRRIAPNDRECARIIGLHGRAAAVKASVPTASFSTYNGYVMTVTTIDHQPVHWILDQGHFRSLYGYKLI